MDTPVTPTTPDSHRRASRAFLQRVGINVRRLREQRRMNQKQFGQWCGLTESLVSDVECGRRNLTLASLEMLAKGLNCCESDLLTQPRTERVS